MTAHSPAAPEGSILTPNGWVTGKVEFAGRTISAVDGRMTAAGAKPKGPFVLPGFIDLHVHGGGGGDWQGGEEGVRTFVRYHASCGTTVMAPTTAIGSIPVIEKSLSAITSIAAVRLPGEAVVLGAHLEGPFINPLKPGAMAASLILEGDAALARSWAEKFKIVIATVAPEVLGGLDVTKALAEMGCRVQIGHSIATPLVTEEAFHCGCSGFTHLFNAMSPLQGRQPGMVGAIYDNNDVRCSVVCDGVHVDFASIRISKKIMQERLFFITDAVTEVSYGEYVHVFKGDRYTLPDGTLSGSSLTMIQCVRNGVEKCGFPLLEALRMASLYPARLMGEDSRLGSIHIGAKADLVLLDEELNLQQVIVDGER